MNRFSRSLVLFIFFYTCIEGLVINVTYPNKIAFVFKDFVILILYILVFVPNLNRIWNLSPNLQRLIIPLFGFAFIMVMCIFLPGNNPLVSAVAIKQRLFYVPLLLIGYMMMRSEKEVKDFLYPLTLFALAVSLFGVLLHFTGPAGLHAMGGNYSADFMTHQYVSESSGPSAVYWRVPGTFTSSGQFGAYLQFSGIVATMIFLNPTTRRRRRTIAAISILIIFLAILVSGSRAPFLLLSASVVLLLILSRKVKKVFVAAAVGYALFAFAFVFLGEGIKDRLFSIGRPEHFERFQTQYFGQLFLPTLIEKPFGVGLGVATIGARHILPDQNVMLVESYLGILAVETGIFGVATFLWVALTLLRRIVKLRTWIRNSPLALAWYGLAIYVISIVLILPIATTIDHAPSNLYFWFSIGIVIKIADLERAKSLAAAPAPPIRLPVLREAPAGRVSP